MEKSIYKASVSGSVEFLKNLMEEDGGIEAIARAGFIGPFKETPPLHVAAMLGHLDFAKLLLRHFPNQVTPLDSQRLTPLHYAAAAGHILVVKEILSSSIHDDDARTAIHVPDADGNTPLHLAIMNGHLGVANQLVSHGALEAVGYGLDGRAGKCLLHFCVMYGRLEALKSLLLESREVNDYRVLAITDGDGNTVLHLATALNQFETVKYLLKNTQVRATVNTINGQGSTALDIAQHMPMKSDSKRAEILEAIFKAGGLSASNLRHPAQTINSGVGSSEEIMILPEVVARVVVPNLDPPLTPSRSPTAAKTPPPKQPARSKSMELRRRKEKWRGERINTLMISAILVAGVAYTGLLNPPGGVLDDDFHDPKNETCVLFPAGRSVMAIQDPIRFAVYLGSNTVSFLVSMATIMILMSGLKQRVVIKILSAAMWVTMSSLLLAYLVSADMLTSEDPLIISRDEIGTVHASSVKVCAWVLAVIVVFLLALMMRIFIWCIKKVYNKLLKRRAVWCFRKSRVLFKRIGIMQCQTYTCSPEKRKDNGDEEHNQLYRIGL